MNYNLYSLRDTLNNYEHIYYSYLIYVSQQLSNKWLKIKTFRITLQKILAPFSISKFS